MNYRYKIRDQVFSGKVTLHEMQLNNLNDDLLYELILDNFSEVPEQKIEPIKID